MFLAASAGVTGGLTWPMTWGVGLGGSQEPSESSESECEGEREAWFVCSVKGEEVMSMVSLFDDVTGGGGEDEESISITGNAPCSAAGVTLPGALVELVSSISLGGAGGGTAVTLENLKYKFIQYRFHRNLIYGTGYSVCSVKIPYM